MINHVFAERVLSGRKEKRLSQADLGKRVGRDASTVSLWESGKNMPKWDLLQNVAKVLDVPAAWLAGMGSRDGETGAVVLSDSVPTAVLSRLVATSDGVSIHFLDSNRNSVAAAKVSWPVALQLSSSLEQELSSSKDWIDAQLQALSPPPDSSE